MVGGGEKMRKIKEGWKKFSKEFKKDRKSYIAWAVPGGVMYLILTGLSIVYGFGHRDLTFLDAGVYLFILIFSILGSIGALFSFIPDLIVTGIFGILAPFLIGMILACLLKYGVEKVRIRILKKMCILLITTVLASVSLLTLFWIILALSKPLAMQLGFLINPLTRLITFVFSFIIIIIAVIIILNIIKDKK